MNRALKTRDRVSVVTDHLVVRAAEVMDETPGPIVVSWDLT